MSNHGVLKGQELAKFSSTSEYQKFKKMVFSQLYEGIQEENCIVYYVLIHVFYYPHPL